MLPFLQLLRLPNLFTAFADILLGFLFSHPSLFPAPQFTLLLVASGMIYSAGMVLNDLFDFQQDAFERPDRPLPSGRVGIGTAKRLGFGLLIGGVFCGCLAGFVHGERSLRPAVVSFGLAGMVLAYDGWLKKTILGPFAMGGCRTLNVLLGMSVGLSATESPFGFTGGQWCAAIGVGVYIVGVTRFARSEASESARLGLLAGVGWMIVGFAILAMLPHVGEFATGAAQFNLPPQGWWLLIGWIALLILRRCFLAIGRPEPAKVQSAVKTCILSLVVLDAAICLGVRRPWWWAVIILLMLLPTMTLGRWVYST